MKNGKRKVGKTNIFGLTFRPAEKLNPENLVSMQFSVLKGISASKQVKGVLLKCNTIRINSAAWEAC